MTPTATVEDVALWCTAPAFRPFQLHAVRWLDWDRDFDLAVGIDGAVTPETWLWTKENGFQYCAVVEGDRALARAAVWTYSDRCWEVAAVRTREEFRGRGMAKSVVSFVTARILGEGRVPTLHTQPTNVAMLGAANAIGFRFVDAEFEALTR